ncbi:MAG: sigma-70 family RNA polymerase sigma factor [Candidatus Pseudobacter hemicellulosilyticus]|uniref:Sigma-70 family RNA polymerase sigma factor n=1 Tax=Candidatus Pseudobacter hemicellulosilyticus TaxID=3121375 RepID=A0AAJ6BEG1_9BACT|nr:MAG: sigma-70 family RNA polymerase sigma factor [Pseudobacter sp.]
MLNIVSQIQQDNQRAFENAYTTHKDKLYGWLLKKTQSTYLAQELLQQSFLKLWTSRAQLNPGLSLDIQLFRIARSLMIDEVRRQVRLKKHLSLMPPADTAADEIGAEQDRRALQARIDETLCQLPDTGQKVFLLSREYGLSYQQIASQLSLSPKTVEYHMSKALLLLRKALLLVSAAISAMLY